jgi:hypothetical protein
MKAASIHYHMSIIRENIIVSTLPTWSILIIGTVIHYHLIWLFIILGKKSLPVVSKDHEFIYFYFIEKKYFQVYKVEDIIII